MIKFIDIIKEKIKYHLRNNNIKNEDVKITEEQIWLYNSNYRLYGDYFEFEYKDNTEKLYYNTVDRISTNNEQATIETINYKVYSFKENSASVFIEILKDILQSRDNIFQILKMDDNLSEKQSLTLTEGKNDKVYISTIKEVQVKTAFFIEAKKYDLARSMVSTISRISSQNVTNFFSSYLKKSEAKFENKPVLYYEALIPSLEAVNKDWTKSFLLQNLIDTYVKYQNHFFDISHDRRKFVVITDEFYGVPKKGFLMLLKDYSLEHTHPLYHAIDTSLIALPKDMSFPVGHPIVNNVYVVHPYNDKFYIPVEEHEEYLFNDRIDEFKTLVQAFGATEIKFSKEHRLKVNRNQSNGLNINVDVKSKAHDVSAVYNQTKEQNNYTNNEASYEATQTATPILSPYIPSNLFWYPKETTWQRMYKQRIDGNNLMSIEEIISSKSYKTVSFNEITDINVALKVFFVKAAVHTKKEIKSSISEEEEMVQKICVSFAPVDKLTKKYQEEKACTKKQSRIKVDYKNKNTEPTPVSFIENREEKNLPNVVGKNIRIPISKEHNVYLDMIYVEGGTYWKGTEDLHALKFSPSSIRKQVTVDSFYISKYLITERLYSRVMRSMYSSSVLPQSLTKGMLADRKNAFNEFNSFVGKLKDITELEFRYPSDSEWEYAARGGVKNRGNKYAGSNNLLEVAWMSKSDYSRIEGVGMKKPNELGVYDMSGNIYETTICEDEEKTILRGGSCESNEQFCTVYHKINDPSIQWQVIEARYVGIRMVLPISEVSKLRAIESNEQIVEIKR